MTAFSREEVARVLAAIRATKAAEVPESSRITVHAAVSRFSVLYEKIRTAVDYKDEHLLRKAAITRILKRQLSLENDSNVIGRHLVRELIAARYLPNATLPETLIEEAGSVVRKLQLMRRTRVGNERDQRWLLGVVAAELEELLDDHSQEKQLVSFLYERLSTRLVIAGSSMDETDVKLQIYIACQRSFSKADDEMLSYKLVRAYYASWMEPDAWAHAPREMALQMIGVESTVLRQLRHPLAAKFLAAVKPWAISLGMLRDVLVEKPEQAETIMGNPDELHAAVARIAERRTRESRGKLRRGTFRAILYLFITKMLLALAIEVPFENILYHQVNNVSLAVNVFFPPVLMLLVGSMIRLPGKDNVKRIQRGVDELLSHDGPKERDIRVARQRGGVGRFLFRVVYAFMFLITFGLVYYVLNLVHFTWLSASIFIFFLCVVSFFAFRLRLAAREYVAVERHDSFWSVLMDFFSLPILRAGQILSQSVSKINIFVFIFDFIIETPYKILLNILEEWFAFMKEKKDELQ